MNNGCSIIIVDYRSMDKTLRYIDLLAQSLCINERAHIVIVDNYFDSDGLKRCKDKYGQCENVMFQEKKIFVFRREKCVIAYCNPGDNLGYAKGNNWGTIVADWLFKDEYYLISNNDLRIKDVLKFSLIEDLFEKDKSIAVIGPRIIGLDGKEQSPHTKPSVWKMLIASYWIKYFPSLWRNGDRDYTGNSKECYRVMGCFMFIRASAFRDVRRFDENTFMFAEEMILSEKLEKKGYKTYFFNDISVIHEHGQTVKKAASIKKAERWSFESQYYYYKNYRNTSNGILIFAKLNFHIYLLILPAMQKLKALKKRCTYLKGK